MKRITHQARPGGPQLSQNEVPTEASLAPEGLPTPWSIAEDYVVEDGQVRVAGSFKGSYLPAAHPEILVELAELADADDAEVLAFVKRWGLLGHEWVMPAERLPGGPQADPIEWIRAHANGLAVCLELVDYLNRDRPSNDLKKYLDSFPDEPAPSPHPLRPRGVKPYQICLHGERHEVQRRLPIAYAAGEGPRYQARLLLHWIVNPNLAGVQRFLELHRGEDDSSLRVGYHFDALISAAYWHMSRFIADEERVARCDYCSRYFLQTHGAQRYCPPDGSGESLCSRKARARRSSQGGSGSPR